MGKKHVAKAINKAVFPGLQGGPHMHTIAAKAVCFAEASKPEFKEYARQVIANARQLAKTLQEKGFNIVSGGTDSHLLVIDLRPKSITGQEAQACLDLIHINCNKNTIPDDPQPPTVCSGLRMGTSAVTTRGLKERDMVSIAEFLVEALEHRNDQAKLAAITEKVKALSSKFPLYRHRLVA
jgi:glycine hydroxymethyltransferase